MKTAKEYVEAFVSETIDAETGVRRYTLFGANFYVDAKGYGFYRRLNKLNKDINQRRSDTCENYTYIAGTGKSVKAGYDSKLHALIRYTQTELGIRNFDFIIKRDDVRRTLRTVCAEHLYHTEDVEAAIDAYLAENTFSDEAIKVAQDASINNDEILAITQREDISDEENLKRLAAIESKARELVELIDSLSTYASLSVLDTLDYEGWEDVRYHLTTGLSEEIAVKRSLLQ